MHCLVVAGLGNVVAAAAAAAAVVDRTAFVVHSIVTELAVGDVVVVAELGHLVGVVVDCFHWHHMYANHWHST